EVTIEPHQGHVPADADGTGAELRPAGVVDVGDVLELEMGATLAVVRKIDLDPAHLTAELPGDRQMARRLAARNLAARIALQPIAAAEPQLARDRADPARDAFGVGDGVPHGRGRGVVAAARDDHAGRTAVVLALADRAGDCADDAADVRCHEHAPPCYLQRGAYRPLLI